MPNPREQFQAELEHQVARLRDLAVKSTDPLITAKAIAASDAVVQNLILEKMESGERLIEVFAFMASKAETEVQIFFRFVSDKESVRLVDAGLLVFVDYANGDVIGIVDPYQLQPEHRPGRPFVTISTLNTMKFAADDQAAKSLGSRQEAFFKKLGVIAMMRGDGAGGIATVRDTRVTTHTWSGGRSDDSTVEYTDDYVDCAAAGDGGILA